MKPLALLRPLSISTSCPSRCYSPSKSVPHNCVSCSSLRPETIEVEDAGGRSEYKPGLFDDLFLSLFSKQNRKGRKQEVGWNSEKPGYDGFIEVANCLMSRSRSNMLIPEVRILRSLFPPLLLHLYKLRISPLGRGEVAAVMVARVTAVTCQWLMATCTVNSVDLPSGASWQRGVFVERCKYLEESKCVGSVSIHVNFQLRLSSRTTEESLC